MILQNFVVQHFEGRGRRRRRRERKKEKGEKKEKKRGEERGISEGKGKRTRCLSID